MEGGLKTLSIVLLPLVLLGGCNRYAAQQAMRATLFEPDTADYSAYAAAPPPHGLLRSLKAPPIVCGGVRARQHTGVYANEKKYVVDRRTGRVAFQSDLVLDKRRYDPKADWPREKKFLANWQAVCVDGTQTYAQIKSEFDWIKPEPPS